MFIAWIGVMSMMGQANAAQAGGPASADWRVWTETETRHVLRDDPPGPGRTVKIAAARNEWESFQILVRSEVPIKGVNVKPDDLFNGEGMLVYPARAVGYDGIVPSIRLSALRDAVEDYEYLAILDRLGLGKEAQKVILPLAESWFRWEKDPAAYARTRAKLAEMITAAQKSCREEPTEP